MYLVLDVHNKNIETVYKTTLCSKATLVVLITTFVGVFVPFVFAYRSRGFWLKHDTFYEQPNVRFRGEYFFAGLTNNVSNFIVCNNIYHFRQLDSLDKCATFKVREIDQNHDGKPDTLLFQVDVAYIPDGHSNFLQYIYLILPLDYKLNTMCPLKMQSAIIIQQPIISRANHVTITANLKLKQKFPIHCHPKITDKDLDYDIISDELLLNEKHLELNDFRFENIFNKYLHRNLTTHLTEYYMAQEFKTGQFRLKLLVDYPEEPILYRPGLWQVLKWAWMQYLAIYIIFAYFLNKLRCYIFNNDLVVTYKSYPSSSFKKILNSTKCS